MRLCCAGDGDESSTNREMESRTGVRIFPKTALRDRLSNGMNMKVLVIGKGGREHALVWKLAQSPRVEKVFCAPGNAGTAIDGENVPIGVDEFDKLIRFAKKEGIGL